VALLHCPNCDTIVKADWDTCRRCLVNLRSRAPITHEGGDAGAYGVMGWVANILGNLTIVLLCVAPVLLVIVGVVVWLFTG
jgi:hypothetical protein